MSKIFNVKNLSIFFSHFFRLSIFVRKFAKPIEKAACKGDSLLSIYIQKSYSHSL